MPLYLVCSAASRSRALPPSTRLPSSVAVPGASGHRPALQHLCPAFTQPCRCIWCAREPPVLDAPIARQFPGGAAVPGVSGCRPALQRLYPAFSGALPAHLVCSAASHSRHSRRPPISQRRCCPWDIGVSASPSALVSGFLGSPTGASDAPGQPAPFARGCRASVFPAALPPEKLLSRPSRRSEGRAGGVCEGDGSPLRTL